ncbi:HAD hydrolase family protein [Branchiibius cervicis]|uniref:HAD hydrolase family protein n=1 Tax=Branchiibius cervicis TaxID=908252 RepID=A0ABW2ARB3_9MICO
MSDGRRRAIFLDIDGTYAAHGVVPPAHVEAVQAARRAGNLVFLCTGRPMSLLSPVMLEPGFDGVVAAAGAYVVVGDEVVCEVQFPADLAHETVAVLHGHGVGFLLEAPEATYALAGTAARLARSLGARSGDLGDAGAIGQDILASLRPLPSDRLPGFAKVVCFDSPVSMARLAAELGPRVGLVPTSLPAEDDTAGELYVAGVHKARGVQAAIEHLGIARADVIAFGDGMNDLEMIEYAGIGVAMAGADEQVLAVADRLADGPEKDGLATAFAELGLV